MNPHENTTKTTTETATGTPLFTPAELRKQKDKLADWEVAFRKSAATHEDRNAIEGEHLHEMRKRVEARAEEFLNGLLVVVGTRGKFVPFEALFSHSADPKIAKLITPYNTPENRRNLYTLLKAFEEIPQNWARSAFVRFLRGNGEQAKPKYAYTGKGMFSKDYGWKEDELNAVCDILMSGRHYGGHYSDMLVTYADVEAEAAADPEAVESGAAYQARLAGVRTEKNKSLIQKLCTSLETRGLGDISVPAIAELKPPKAPKNFEPGTIIRKGTLKDLPLPAHIKVQIEKNTDGKPWSEAKWVRDEVEWVVTKLHPNGRATCYRAGPATAGAPSKRVAYISPEFWGQEYKDFLYGAEYLGAWEGKLDSKNAAEYPFKHRKLELKKTDEK